MSLGCLLPIHPLTLKVSGAKDRLTVTTCGLMDFARGFRPQPAALDRGLVTHVRCINTQDRSVLLIAFRSNGCDNLVPPLFFPLNSGHAPASSWQNVSTPTRPASTLFSPCSHSPQGLVEPRSRPTDSCSNRRRGSHNRLDIWPTRVGRWPKPPGPCDWCVRGVEWP